MGIIPPHTKLTPRDATMASWDPIPLEQRAFQSRLMEIFAGFMEHTDQQIGALMAGLEARGLKDNRFFLQMLDWLAIQREMRYGPN